MTMNDHTPGAPRRPWTRPAISRLPGADAEQDTRNVTGDGAFSKTS